CRERGVTPMAKKALRRSAEPALFPELTANGRHASKEQGYEPLPSVWLGTDAELLERMLDFYPKRAPEKILDATVNTGRFWVGSSRNVTGMDIDARHKPDVVGDNTSMPFEDETFDVVVYDPPHIPNQGKDTNKDFNTRFG